MSGFREVYTNGAASREGTRAAAASASHPRRAAPRRRLSAGVTSR